MSWTAGQAFWPFTPAWTASVELGDAREGRALVELVLADRGRLSLVREPDHRADRRRGRLHGGVGGGGDSGQGETGALGAPAQDAEGRERDREDDEDRRREEGAVMMVPHPTRRSGVAPYSHPPLSRARAIL